MIESGVDLRSVQLLLGHASIRSTAKYIHLTQARMQSLKSPLDALSQWQRRNNERLRQRQRQPSGQSKDNGQDRSAAR